MERFYLGSEANLPQRENTQEKIIEPAFKDTLAFRKLNALGVLDLQSDPTGRTFFPGKRYIRATLPDGKGGVQAEAVYRIDAITDARVALVYVEKTPDGIKKVRSSTRGETDGPFWSDRFFLIVTIEDWEKGEQVG